MHGLESGLGGVSYSNRPRLLTWESELEGWKEVFLGSSGPRSRSLFNRGGAFWSEATRRAHCISVFGTANRSIPERVRPFTVGHQKT